MTAAVDDVVDDVVAAIELGHTRRDPVQHPAIVAHDDRAGRAVRDAGEVAFQPADGDEAQLVRWPAENQ